MPCGWYKLMVNNYDYLYFFHENTMFLALSGILFPGREEASYSNFRLWESTGSVITYAYNPYLCTNLKLYLLLGLLFIGIAGYTVIELMERRKVLPAAGQLRKGKFELVKDRERREDETKSGEVAE